MPLLPLFLPMVFSEAGKLVRKPLRATGPTLSLRRLLASPGCVFDSLNLHNVEANDPTYLGRVLSHVHPIEPQQCNR